MSNRKKSNNKITKSTNLNTDYKNFTIDPVDIAFGKLVILENTKLKIAYGEHYGLVGKNGIGKTSLLNAINNRTINIPEKLDMIYVKQEEPESNNTLLDTLLSANEKIYILSKKLAELEELVSHIDVTQELIDQYYIVSKEIGSEHLRAKANAQKILNGLGFGDNDQYRNVSEFSGGWRMRIALAKALFMTPTLLILDEPTNHLDLHANIWLTEYLRTYPKTIIVISHDKYFIDEVCTVIVNIYNKKLKYYRGNYEQFQSQLQLEKDKIQKDWLQFQRKIEAMKKNKKTQTEINDFVRSVDIIKPEKEFAIKINFMEPSLIKGTFISLNNIMFGYEKPIYYNMTFDISATSRIAIVGKNGIGKSTLLKLINGDIVPSSGEVYKASNLRIGYYNQHFEESMPYTIDGIKYLNDLNSEIDITTARKYLSMFGLEPQYHKTNLGLLSGGQKARVKFSSFGVSKPHLLMLDEPTNHLDIVAIESLINALNNFNGAILLVTHNFDLITRLNAELWVVDNGSLYKYQGDYKQYIEELLQ